MNIEHASSGSVFERIALGALLVVAALAPVFFIPSLLVSFSFSKTVLIFSATLVALIGFIFARLKEGRMSIPRRALFFAPWGIVLAYFLSGILSGGISNAFFGTRLESDTVAFFFIGALLFTLSALLFDSKKKMLQVHFGLLIASILVALFELLHFFFGSSFGVFIYPISNLIGSWNDLAIFFGLIVISSLLHLEAVAMNGMVRAVLSIAFLVSLFFLMVVNFAPVWVVAGLFGLGLFVYRFFCRLFERGDVQGGRGVPQRLVSIFALMLLASSALFLVAGDTLNSVFVRTFNTAQLEARPSWQSTMEVAGATYRENFFFGSGPNTFAEQWGKYRSVAINHTPFWNVDFSAGIGTIPTSFVTVGLLGGIAWLLFLGFLIAAGLRTLMFEPLHDRFGYHLTLVSFIAALYLWVLSVFYVPGEVMFMLAFLFSGLFVASLRMQDSSKQWTFSFTENPRIGFASILALSVGLIAGLGFLYVTGQKYLASVYFGRAVFAANQNSDLDGAKRFLDRALSLGGSDQYLRFASELHVAKLGSIVSSDTLSEDEARSEFQATLGDAIAAGLSATEWNSDDYRNWMALGRVYQAVVPLKIRGAYESAKASFERAAALNPSSPLIPLSLAELSAQNGDNAAARAYITEALRRKNDYTDAIFLLSQLEIGEGKISEAISSVEAATVLEPNNSVIFFQLGLLRYGTGSIPQAIEALERAVALNGSYSNARYYLGLSYAREGRREDAVEQFERIRELNPDNADVKTILANLRAGKDPLTPSQAAALKETTTPPIREE